MPAAAASQAAGSRNAPSRLPTLEHGVMIRPEVMSQAQIRCCSLLMGTCPRPKVIVKSHRFQHVHLRHHMRWGGLRRR